jgi:hypothetical protein
VVGSLARQGIPDMAGVTGSSSQGPFQHRITIAAGPSLSRTARVVPIDASQLITGVEQRLRGDGDAGDRAAGRLWTSHSPGVGVILT